ncbi:MAG TPA: class I SAM-dependent methyltransferase [Solirubrobacteraceae bacterium]
MRTNAQIWAEDDFVEFYASRDLRPVESLLLACHREALAGHVLELGCGAGRLTGHLIEVAQSVHGLDVSPAMVAYCRRSYPRGTFSQGDLCDLSRFGEASFDAVIAPFNVLDALGDSERQGVLEQIHGLMRRGGILIMSSHNRDYVPRIGPAFRVLLGSPRQPLHSLRSMPRRLRNRRSLRRLERSEADYSLRNDESHDFSLLHYYISRGAQERQLGEHGFELIECRDLDGRVLSPDQTAARCPELHYVARTR